MPPKNAFQETANRMEADLMSIGQGAALASIAISLKRIADTLERANFNSDIFVNAIQDAIYRGLLKGN